MKEIGCLPIDFTKKCNLAEIAKKYEGRNVYLILKCDSWDDAYVAVMETEQTEKVYTFEEQLKKVQEELKVMTKMYLTLRNALERVRSNYKSDIPICYDFVEAIELTLSEHDDIILNLHKSHE